VKELLTLYLPIAFGIVICFLMWFFGKTQRVRRAFKSQTVSKIEACQDNQVHKICGDLHLAQPTLTSPLTGRRCAVYKISAEAYCRTSDGGHWADIINDERKTNFLIKDGSFYAYITTYCATLLLHKDEKFDVKSITDAPQQLKNYLEAYGIHKTGLSNFDLPIRCEEGILEDGEKVAVMGAGSWHDIANFQELNFLKAEGVSKVFIIKNDFKNPFFISDDIEVLNF